MVIPTPIPAHWQRLKQATQCGFCAGTIFIASNVVNANPPRPITDVAFTKIAKNTQNDCTESMTFIDTLGEPGLDLVRPIIARIEMEDGVFLVSFDEANISASGETLPEAIELLKHMLAFNYRCLAEKSPDLSEALRHRLSVLRQSLLHV